MTPFDSLRDKTRKSLDAAVELLKTGTGFSNALFAAGRCSAYSEILHNIDEQIKDDAAWTPPSPDKQNVPVWRWAKAGTTFPSEALVISDEDNNPYLVKTAVFNCMYLLVDDLWKYLKAKLEVPELK